MQRACWVFHKLRRLHFSSCKLISLSHLFHHLHNIDGCRVQAERCLRISPSSIQRLSQASRSTFSLALVVQLPINMLVTLSQASRMVPRKTISKSRCQCSVSWQLLSAFVFDVWTCSDSFCIMLYRSMHPLMTGRKVLAIPLILNLMSMRRHTLGMLSSWTIYVRVILRNSIVWCPISSRKFGMWPALVCMIFFWCSPSPKHVTASSAVTNKVMARLDLSGMDE